MDWLTGWLSGVCPRVHALSSGACVRVCACLWDAWSVEKLMAWAWTLVALGWLAGGGSSRGPSWLASYSACI